MTFGGHGQCSVLPTANRGQSTARSGPRDNDYRMNTTSLSPNSPLSPNAAATPANKIYNGY